MSVNRDRYNRTSKKDLIDRLETEVLLDRAVTESELEEASTDEISDDSTTRNDDYTTTGRHRADRTSYFRWMLILLCLLLAIVVCLGLTFVGFVDLGNIEGRIATFFRKDPEYIRVLVSDEKYHVSPVVAEGVKCVSLSDPGMLDLQAKSYYVVFVDGFEVVASQGEDIRLPYASIVKLLGVMVALEEYSMDDELGLLEEVDDEGNGCELEVGELVKIRDLVAACVVSSKNDAMYVLAQNYPGGTDAFVRAMNAKAEQIGLQSTKVVNPLGLDSPGQHSTVRDIAVMAVASMNIPEIADFAQRGAYTLKTSSGREVTMWSTNGLIGVVPDVVGLKTGYTGKAGQCLVTYVANSPDFVTVVLGSEDRIENSLRLINWAKTDVICR